MGFSLGFLQLKKWRDALSAPNHSSPLSRLTQPHNLIHSPILSAEDMQSLGKELAEINPPILLNYKTSDAQKQGEQASPYLGSGLEYEESRLYQPGDEVRRINWRLKARTGQTYTKLFDEERQENWCVLVDQRQSMRFGTKTRLKVVQAIRVAGYYAWHAEQAGLALEAIRLSEGAAVAPLREGRGLFEETLNFLSVPCPPQENIFEARLYDELLDCQQRLQKGTRLIVISDFADLDEKTRLLLAAMQERLMVKVVLIYDAAEKRLPNMKGLSLRGIDGSETSELTSDQQEEYRLWAAAYFKDQMRQLSQLGLHVFQLATDEALDLLAQQENARGFSK